MMFLPDSAIVGTAKRLNRVGKPARPRNARKGLMDDLAYLGRPRVKAKAKREMQDAKANFRAEWAKALGRA